DILRRRATASSQYKKKLRTKRSIVSKSLSSKPFLPGLASQKWFAQWMQGYRILANGSGLGTVTSSINTPGDGKPYIFRRNLPDEKASTDLATTSRWSWPRPDGKIIAVALPLK